MGVARVRFKSIYQEAMQLVSELRLAVARSRFEFIEWDIANSVFVICDMHFRELLGR